MELQNSFGDFFFVFTYLNISYKEGHRENGFDLSNLEDTHFDHIIKMVSARSHFPLQLTRFLCRASYLELCKYVIPYLTPDMFAFFCMNS